MAATIRKVQARLERAIQDRNDSATEVVTTVATAGAGKALAKAADVYGNPFNRFMFDRNAARAQNQLDKVEETTTALKKTIQTKLDNLNKVAPKGVIGSFGKSVVNNAIKGTLNKAARAKLIGQLEKLVGRKVDVVYGASKNFFDPNNGKIYLKWANDDLIPRGTFFEEVQHLIDDAAKVNPSTIPGIGTLENAQFHRDVFNRMIDNPLFDISDAEGLNLSATIREILRGLRG